MRPIIGRLGPLTVYSYGTMLVLGVVAATLLALARARRYGRRWDEVLALAVTAYGGGLAGGYLLYLVTILPELVQDPSLVGRAGGMVFYGGLFGAAAACAGIARLLHIPLAPAVELAAPAVPLGQALGRIGCLLAGCCHGRPTGAAWAAPFGGRHPVQLYEAAGLLALCAGLLVLERRQPRPYTLALGYLAGYGALRLAVEHWRGDAIRGFVFGGALSTSQLIALVVGGAAVALLCVRGRRGAV
jgi:phosphatidylglycerol:prolipoprotein diacylglycerol transferase